MDHPYTVRVLDLISAKMPDAWQAIGNLASVAGLTSLAVNGYQAYGSAYTTLMETERILEKVKSRLDGLSDQRRYEIEIAARGNPSCKTLKDLEVQLQACVSLIYCMCFFRTQIHGGIH